MTDAMRAEQEPARSGVGDLAHWRILRTALAALSAILAGLWLVGVVAGPLGPVTGSWVTPWLIFVFMGWVVVDLVVRALDREAQVPRPG